MKKPKIVQFETICFWLKKHANKTNFKNLNERIVKIFFQTVGITSPGNSCFEKFQKKYNECIYLQIFENHTIFWINTKHKFC